MRSFNHQALPSLHHKGDDLNGVHFRTMNIDYCPIRLNLKSNSVEPSDLTESTLIDSDSDCYLILAAAPISIHNLDKICQRIWNTQHSMKNCVVAYIPNNQRQNKVYSVELEINIVRKWKIPMITMDCSDSQSVRDLFEFLMKYYWFNNAQSN